MSESKFGGFRHRWSEYEWRVIRGEAVETPLNHALDEAFTRRVGGGESPPTLRFWGRGGAEIAFGRFQSLRNEVDLEKAKRYGFTANRRMTGGGAMFVEPENIITYSLTVPLGFVQGMTTVESYEFLDEWVVAGLRSLGIEAYYEPINDLSSSAGKIGGSAQARSFGAVLHHATLSYDIDARRMLEVLRIGQEKVSDKAIQSAEKRVGPIRRQTEIPKEEVISRLIETFTNHFANGNAEQDTVHEDELEEARRLVESRYGTREWTELIP